MIKKIRTEDLQVGMFVEDFNTPWLHHPFFTKRKLLRRPRDIQVILEHGIPEVLINTAKGKDLPRDPAPRRRPSAPVPAGPPSPPREPRPAAFSEELHRARAVYTEAEEVIRAAFEELGRGRALEPEPIQRTVRELISSVFRNRDALVSLTGIRSHDEHTFRHSVNTAVYALCLGAHLGILQQELLILGVGALLHDVGKTRLPRDLLLREARLGPRDRERFRQHPLHGAKIVLDTRGLPKGCAALALNHHERHDGGGYPRGISGGALGKLASVTAIADTYDTLLRPRGGRGALSPHHAVRCIYQGAHSAFPPVMAQKFVQCFGVYPLGSAVELDTGEVGVVCRLNPGHLLHPRVRVVRDRGGRPLARPFDVDLRPPEGPGACPAGRSIVRALGAEEAGMDVAQLLAAPPAPGAAAAPAP
ncbi:MAG: HD-GYP domain-containing protein [Deferrisomatales bacterium]